MQRSLFRAVVALGLALAVPAADAATFRINDIDAGFTNLQTRRTWGGIQGEGTSVITWGVASREGRPRSSYRFDGDPVTRTTTGSFLLGRYTHRNGTLWANSTNLRRSDLGLTVRGAANGRRFTIESAFRLIHNETLNPGRPCAAGGPRPCGDRVDIRRLVGQPVTIRQGGDTFTLLIDGFVRRLGGPVVNSFRTREGRQRSLFLQASLTISPDQTTVPPTTPPTNPPPTNPPPVEPPPTNPPPTNPPPTNPPPTNPPPTNPPPVNPPPVNPPPVNPPPVEPPPAPIPLPAGAPLLLGALGLLAVVRRRRR